MLSVLWLHIVTYEACVSCTQCTIHTKTCWSSFTYFKMF